MLDLDFLDFNLWLSFKQSYTTIKLISFSIKETIKNAIRLDNNQRLKSKKIKSNIIVIQNYFGSQ